MVKRLLIKELYDPVQNGYHSPDLDLVLVHGLDGDPIETWKHQTSDVVWPQELLPKSRPHTRVLSFGYNGDMYRNNSVAGIRGNARALLAQLDCRRDTDPRRPIIFVAHCLGGLIVKQALCFANSEDEYRRIAFATRGIHFFGTPHFGADKSQWRLIAKGFSPLSRAKGIDGRKLSSLVDAISRDADQLNDICEDFQEISGRYPITSFYETGHWPGTKACIVDESSARIQLPNELSVTVGADHTSICRFENKEDETFQKVCQQINKVLGKVVHTEVGVSGEAGEWGKPSIVSSTIQRFETVGDASCVTEKVRLIEYQRRMAGGEIIEEVKASERTTAWSQDERGGDITRAQRAKETGRGRGNIFQWMTNRPRYHTNYDH